MALQSTRVVWAVAVLMVLTGCGRPAPPEGPSSEAPASAAPGTTIVNGTERLNWLQSGDILYLVFLAYVDGTPVPLDDATCNWAAAEVECSSPLPSMAEGVHTITVAAMNPSSGVEGPSSASITVQRVSTRSVVSAVLLPDQAFSIDVIARGLRGPLQLAGTPDGRLLIADGEARVRVVRPDGSETIDGALDARQLLQPPPAGGLGVAVHPEFARNHFVYVSFLARDRSGRTELRIVRLREVGDTLGEPLSLFGAPIMAVREPSRVADDAPAAVSDLSSDTPRLAFGPDGLLYTLLPDGFAFDNEPAASSPHSSMLRIEDDGRRPPSGPLTGIIAHPLGFGWHPSTAALWLIFPGVNGETVVRPSGVSSSTTVEAVAGGVLRMMDGSAPSSGALVLDQTGALDLAGRFLNGVAPESVGVLRLVMPVLAESVLAGVAGRITDIVPAGGGALYVTTNDGGGRSDGGDAVLRLTPRAR
jgi:glucose/arabinose dehydrogenase